MDISMGSFFLYIVLGLLFVIVSFVIALARSEGVSSSSVRRRYEIIEKDGNKIKKKIYYDYKRDDPTEYIIRIVKGRSSSPSTSEQPSTEISISELDDQIVDMMRRGQIGKELGDRLRGTLNVARRKRTKKHVFYLVHLTKSIFGLLNYYKRVNELLFKIKSRKLYREINKLIEGIEREYILFTNVEIGNMNLLMSIYFNLYTLTELIKHKVYRARIRRKRDLDILKKIACGSEISFRQATKALGLRKGLLIAVRGFLGNVRKKIKREKSESEEFYENLTGRAIIHQFVKDCYRRLLIVQSMLLGYLGVAFIGANFVDRIKRAILHAIGVKETTLRIRGEHLENLKRDVENSRDDLELLVNVLCYRYALDVNNFEKFIILTLRIPTRVKKSLLNEILDDSIKKLVREYITPKISSVLKSLKNSEKRIDDLCKRAENVLDRIEANLEVCIFNLNKVVYKYNTLEDKEIENILEDVRNRLESVTEDLEEERKYIYTNLEKYLSEDFSPKNIIKSLKSKGIRILESSFLIKKEIKSKLDEINKSLSQLDKLYEDTIKELKRIGPSNKNSVLSKERFEKFKKEIHHLIKEAAEKRDETLLIKRNPTKEYIAENKFEFIRIIDDLIAVKDGYIKSIKIKEKCISKEIEGVIKEILDILPHTERVKHIDILTKVIEKEELMNKIISFYDEILKEFENVRRSIENAMKNNTIDKLKLMEINDNLDIEIFETPEHIIERYNTYVKLYNNPNISISEKKSLLSIVYSILNESINKAINIKKAKSYKDLESFLERIHSKNINVNKTILVESGVYRFLLGIVLTKALEIYKRDRKNVNELLLIYEICKGKERFLERLGYSNIFPIIFRTLHIYYEYSEEKDLREKIKISKKIKEFENQFEKIKEVHVIKYYDIDEKKFKELKEIVKKLSEIHKKISEGIDNLIEELEVKINNFEKNVDEKLKSKVKLVEEKINEFFNK